LRKLRCGRSRVTRQLTITVEIRRSSRSGRMQADARVVPEGRPVAPAAGIYSVSLTLLDGATRVRGVIRGGGGETFAFVSGEPLARVIERLLREDGDAEARRS
jgi:hypothetical protein